MDLGVKLPQPSEPPPPADGGPSAITLLVAAVALVVGGYFLSAKLRHMSQIQDCALSGRTNCAAIEAPAER